jgi:hypothetical protein
MNMRMLRNALRLAVAIAATLVWSLAVVPALTSVPVLCFGLGYGFGALATFLVAARWEDEAWRSD